MSTMNMLTVADQKSSICKVEDTLSRSLFINFLLHTRELGIAAETLQCPPSKFCFKFMSLNRFRRIGRP